MLSGEKRKISYMIIGLASYAVTYSPPNITIPSS